MPETTPERSVGEWKAQTSWRGVKVEGRMIGKFNAKGETSAAEAASKST